MISSLNSNLSQIVAQSEKTKELSEYWKNRYDLILNNNLFIVSEKTSQILENNDPIIDKPITPFGDISLINHLDANLILDETKLQSTVETAVRFLDGALEVINFSSEARFIVSQYRKIGLGIADISQYLEKNNQSSQLDLIDQLGNLISNAAYRASETLAMEKSPCKNWDKLKKHLRPKSFELWTTPNSEEKRTGLALSYEFDLESIKKSDYEIIPRRNSNILLFPADLEWQIWSDRDETAPPTPVEKLVVSPPEISLIDFDSSVETNKSDEVKIHNQSSFKDQLPESVLDHGKSWSADDNAWSDQNFHHLENESNQLETRSSHDLLNYQGAKSESIPQTESFQSSQSLEHNQSELDVSSGEDVVTNVVFEDPIDKETEAEPHSYKNTSVNGQIEIGELVRIVRRDDPHYDQIFQVIDVLEGNPKRYQLGGGTTRIENILWREKDLEPIDLDDLIDALNQQSEEDENRQQKTTAFQAQESVKEQGYQKLNTFKDSENDLLVRENQELKASMTQLQQENTGLKAEIKELKNELQRYLDTHKPLQSFSPTTTKSQLSNLKTPSKFLKQQINTLKILNKYSNLQDKAEITKT